MTSKHSDELKPGSLLLRSRIQRFAAHPLDFPSPHHLTGPYIHLIERAQRATNGDGCDFAHIAWHQHRGGACTQPRKEPTAQHAQQAGGSHAAQRAQQQGRIVQDGGNAAGEGVGQEGERGLARGATGLHGLCAADGCTPSVAAPHCCKAHHLPT